MLGYLFVVTLPGGIVGAIILVCREGLRRAEREMVFVLDETGIIRRRSGYSEVKIGFSEIGYLSEELKWLVVESNEPRRKIAIAKDVAGFATIRAELAKHHALSPSAKSPLRSAAFAILSILSWAAIICFSDVRVVLPAGVVAMASLALGSHRLWLLLHRGPKRWLMWISLGFVWFSAILVIYFRYTRT